jgi:alpha-tubulin suppressor-like RCC1 family protein
MFSWGCGGYGALGFGNRLDVAEPKKLEIVNQDGNCAPVIGVACGKQHSICIT